MQIHEVFGFSAVKNALDVGPGANARAAQRQQDKFAASAAKSAEKLRKQGYGQPTAASSANQLISQVQADSAAQQLIRTWAAQWPKLAANVPSAPPPSAAPAAPAEPLVFGGQQLDPNDPVDARIISQLRTQGKLNEQQSAAPDPAQYRKQFVKWADDVVERTIRQSGVIEAMKQDSDWAQQFAQAEDAVVSTIDNAQENSQAVQAYLTLAVAAARAYQQERPSAANRAQVTSGLNDPQANALATTLGLDAVALTKLNAFIRRNNETINPQGTGSASLDALLRAAKLLK
jgi:hypothetical protein